MYTLILKIPMDENKCAHDRDNIRKALRVLAGCVHIDITDEELVEMWAWALQVEGSVDDNIYEIVED